MTVPEAAARAAAHVTVAGEGVEHQHGVVAGRVELAPALVGEARERQPLAVLGAEGPQRGEQAPAGGVAVAPGAARRGPRAQQSRVGLGDGRRRHRVLPEEHHGIVGADRVPASLAGVRTALHLGRTGPSC